MNQVEMQVQVSRRALSGDPGSAEPVRDSDIIYEHIVVDMAA